ncbi:MAG: proteasome endopeptidase complex, archaeal, beta subunit [Thermoprotei archaeon]|mgnify:CR=1 FL=1|nr:MAG: proteasome endopeptidase complex, archaeal, beta subunit [Thermoprotei archaeon]
MGFYHEKVIKGTTTVGIRIRDGVILAADKRATAGYYIAHKNVDKIIRVDDRAALTTAGLVADAQVLANFLRIEAKYYKYITGKPMSIKAMASLLSILLNTSKYFPYIVQLLLGGYDDAPRLFAIEWFGDVTAEPFTATGSGSPIAIGVIEENYREDMSIDNAVKLAIRAITAATKRDSASGEGIDVAVITKEGFKKLSYKLSQTLS